MQALYYGGWQQVDLRPQRWNVWSPEANDRASHAKTLSSAAGYVLSAATISSGSPRMSNRYHARKTHRTLVVGTAHSETQ